MVISCLVGGERNPLKKITLHILDGDGLAAAELQQQQKRNEPGLNPLWVCRFL